MRGVSDTFIAVRDKLRGKTGQTKVKRYWPGKSPEWADGDDNDDDTRPLERLEMELEERRMKSICERILIQREQEVAEECEYERATIIERERLEAEQQALEEELKKRRIEEMKKETKPQIVVVKEEMRKDDGEIIQKNMESKANYIAADVDTDDEAKVEEYEACLVRNIARFKRDREDREDAAVRDKEKIENMTEEERREWELKPAGKQQPKKHKWRFMHKYFHKGAFFLSQVDDDDDIYTRDYSCAPSGEERQHG